MNWLFFFENIYTGNFDLLLRKINEINLLFFEGHTYFEKRDMLSMFKLFPYYFPAVNSKPVISFENEIIYININKYRFIIQEKNSSVKIILESKIKIEYTNKQDV